MALEDGPSVVLEKSPSLIFNNCASKGQFNGLLANRAVPTVEAVIQLSFKEQSQDPLGRAVGAAALLRVGHAVPLLLL